LIGFMILQRIMNSIHIDIYIYTYLYDILMP